MEEAELKEGRENENIKHKYTTGSESVKQLQEKLNFCLFVFISNQN
jgi:hypothetical protein